MSLTVDDLRSHVLYRPTEWKRFLLVKYRLFAETKVGQFYVTVGIQQDAAVTSSDRKLYKDDTHIINKQTNIHIYILL